MQNRGHQMDLGKSLRLSSAADKCYEAIGAYRKAVVFDFVCGSSSTKLVLGMLFLRPEKVSLPTVLAKSGSSAQSSGFSRYVRIGSLVEKC